MQPMQHEQQKTLVGNTGGFVKDENNVAHAVDHTNTKGNPGRNQKGQKCQ
jgi:hypothetical protein